MKLSHTFRLSADPHHRVTFLVDSPFSLHTARGDELVDHVGPPSADQRQASYVVPEGCDGLIVRTPPGACLTLVSVHPCKRSETVDQTRHPDFVSADDAPITDSLANQVARILYGRGDFSSEPETIEEASDFEMDDEEDFPFEVEFRRMVEEELDDSPLPEESKKAPEAAQEAAEEPIEDSERAG